MREFRNIPVDAVDDENNPRQTFSEARLQELAASISVYGGVIQPIIVSPNGGDRFRLRAGKRRLRASRLAGLTHILARVLDVDDDKGEAIALVENIQRVELEALDEAAAYQHFLDRDHTRTLNELSVMLGKPKRYVHDRLKLNQLIDEAKDLVANGALPIDYAIEIASVPVDRQSHALQLCYLPLLNGERRREHLQPLSELKDWIEKTVRLDPRSEDTQIRLPQLADHIQQLEEQQGASILSLSTLLNHTPEDRNSTSKPILARSWKPAESDEDRCEYARPAVIEVGPGKGDFFHVCVAKESCAKHWPRRQAPTATTDDPDATAAADTTRREHEAWEREQAEAERWRTELRPRALRLIATRTKRLRWTPALFERLLNHVTSDDGLGDLVPSIDTLPRARYPQAVALALCVHHSWRREDLLRLVKALAIAVSAKDLREPPQEVSAHTSVPTEPSPRKIRQRSSKGKKTTRR